MASASTPTDPFASEGDDPVVADAFMTCAAASAKAGVKLNHGGPFGACVVKGGIVVSCAHNSVLLDKDPTCHAEMNAVRQACAALQSHDLSDCELYTSCEPCPMCWGAVQWARLNKVYIGADRFTAAKYGFDDKVFYDEMEGHAGSFGLHRYGFVPGADKEDGEIDGARVHESMLDVHVGILSEEVEPLFTCTQVNKSFRRRRSKEPPSNLKDAYQHLMDQPVPGAGPRRPSVLLDGVPTDMPTHVSEDVVPKEQHEEFMREALKVVHSAVRAGTSKEREPFAAVVVHNGKVLARASNSVLQTRDATATAEVNAIRMAAAALDDYDLKECTLYSTAVPDVMSMAACLWARIPNIYCGVTQEFALRHGHEEGWMHFEELMGDVGKRQIQAVPDVSKSVCEDVFKFWTSCQGKIY